MTDITPHFNIALQKHGAQPVLKQEYDLNRINTFLQEAYSINARIADLTRTLRSIRPSYLSTAPASKRKTSHSGQTDQNRPLTDQERDAFDAQSKQLLRQLNGAITGLKQAEEVRLQTADSVALSKRARGGLGALGRWAAGGAVTAKSPDEELEEARRKTIAGFREAVIMFLQLRLEAAGRVQGEMMEVRLRREVERSKSALYKSRPGATIPYANDDDDMANATSGPSKKQKRQSGGYNPAQDAAPTEALPAELTQDQLQMFAAENSEMLKHYEDQLDQIAQAERSIMDISELHSTLHANLQVQSEHIDQLVQDSYMTTENLGKGNQELKKASERKSTAQALFYSTAAFCTFLVVWDLVF